MQDEEQKTKKRRNIWHIASNGGTIKTFTFNTMKSYKLSEIDAKDIIFSAPRKSGNGYHVQVHLLKDGATVPLLIKSPEPTDEKQDVPKNWCFCFGIKKWESKDKRKPDNYTTGIILQRSDTPTDYQTQWIHDYKEQIVSACIAELVRIKDSVKRPNLTPNSDSLTSGSFSRMEEKDGSVILNLKVYDTHADCPTEFLLYPNLEPILTGMEGRKCNVKFEILIDGIFVGSNAITIQAKLARACVAEVKKRRMVLAPMRIVVPDDEIHVEGEVDEVEIPEGSEDEKSESKSE